MGKRKSNGGIRIMKDRKIDIHIEPEPKDIGGMSHKKLMDLAKGQDLKTTDWYKSLRRHKDE